MPQTRSLSLGLAMHLPFLIYFTYEILLTASGAKLGVHATAIDRHDVQARVCLFVFFFFAAVGERVGARPVYLLKIHVTKVTAVIGVFPRRSGGAVAPPGV